MYFFSFLFFIRIEHLLGKQLPLYPCEEDEVLALQERVNEAQRTAKLELKDIEDRRGQKGRKREGAEEFDDTEQFMGARKRFKGPQGKGGAGGGGRGGGGGGKKKFKGKR